MSFESGRKLGLISSLIAVIVPVAAIILDGFLLLSALGAVLSAVSGGTGHSAGALLSGITFALVGLGVTGLVGIILFLVAMYFLAHYYDEPGIFKNALYGFLIIVIGVAVVLVVMFAFLFAAIFSSAAHSASSFSPLGFLAVFLVVLAAGFALSIVSAVLYKRAFDKLGEKSGVDSFKTAGLLYLVGSVTSIVLIGGLIAWLAWIFAASGFYSLKPKTVEPSTGMYSVPQPPATGLVEKKFCVYCGQEISLDSLYCRYCGKPVDQ